MDHRTPTSTLMRAGPPNGVPSYPASQVSQIAGTQAFSADQRARPGRRDLKARERGLPSEGSWAMRPGGAASS